MRGGCPAIACKQVRSGLVTPQTGPWRLVPCPVVGRGARGLRGGVRVGRTAGALRCSPALSADERSA
eukprot:3883350-Alexandrium_andersonii.AAC.1